MQPASTTIPCPTCGSYNYYENAQPGRLLPCPRCNRFFLCPDPNAPPPRPPSGRMLQARPPQPTDQATVAHQALLPSGATQAAQPRSGPNANAIAELQKQVFEVRQLVQTGRGQIQAELDAFRRDLEQIRDLVASTKHSAPQGSSGSHDIEELEEAHQQLSDQLQATREQQDELFRLVRGLKEAPSASASDNPPAGLEAALKPLQEQLHRIQTEQAKLTKLIDDRTQDLQDLWQQNEQTRQQASDLGHAVEELRTANTPPSQPSESTETESLRQEQEKLRRLLFEQRQTTLELVQRLERNEERLAQMESDGERISLNTAETADLSPIIQGPATIPLVEHEAVTAPTEADLDVESEPALGESTDLIPILKAPAKPPLGEDAHEPPPPSPEPRTALPPIVSKAPAKGQPLNDWLLGLAPAKSGQDAIRDQLFQLEALHAELEGLRKELEDKDRAISRTLALSMAYQGASPDSSDAREASRIREELQRMEHDREQLRERVAEMEARFIELSEIALQKKHSAEVQPEPSPTWQHGIHFQLLVDDETAEKAEN